MDISIVMTVYNGEEFVKEAVQSVLDQTYHHFEFIIVDDYSTDRTKDILAAFKDSRLKVYHLDKNLGQTYALNYGIDQARGDWIFRQDADDISLPERLEKQITFIKEHPDTVAVGTQIRGISALRTADAHSVRAIEWSNALLTREEIKKYRFIAPPIVHGTVAFSKEAFYKAGKYNERYQIGQDLDLWIRLLEIGPIDKVPEVLYHYRVDPQSISRKDETKTCKESLTCTSFHIENKLKKERNHKPNLLVAGPSAGSDYFRDEIASVNELTVIEYVNEEQGFQVILEKFWSQNVDAIIVLDGKHSEKLVADLVDHGLEFNSQVFRLWNIFMESTQVRGKNGYASIVVPCYNALSSIRNTILSLGRQTLKHYSYEIIIVDDASTDGTYELLKTFHLPNLKIIRHLHNKGAAAARNTGVVHAKGDLIIFCDSDFIVPPWFIESHIQMHEKKERAIVSGMGRWHYLITFNFDRQWSSYEKKYVKPFYNQSFIQKRLRAAEDGHLVHESDIYSWNMTPFYFCPAYLTEWAEMASDIYKRYGPEIKGFYLPWISCCTGNLSIRKEHFLELNGFDESLTRLEDWEFGYRFYQSGGKFIYGERCEALQQLGPISPKRNPAQREAFQLLRQKHPHFEVCLLALLFYHNLSFIQLSTIYEQHQMIKQDPARQIIAEKMEKSLRHYAGGGAEELSKQERQYFNMMISSMPLEYGAWVNLFQRLHK
ncbi:glycosyltransferase family 2 protein [Bacillus sp. USDA818B3_A]|uniref:glycosyltransferase family 2 protein n=1 Tax=Bacillus sp. USDA818B3_A TaxID=2698834 RepID=UPI001369FD7C|nr:glycosyltransferase family 2 protein [Bacillus sp. USDA818B3_A]